MICDMGTDATMGFADVEVSGIRVGREDHVTGTIDNAVGCVGCHIVKVLEQSDAS